MRSIALLLAVAALASCAVAPQPGRSADAESHFQKLIAGRVAGQPVSCLPSYRANDMVIIDDQTVAFRDGRRTWVTDLGPGCSNLGSGFYALVTRRHGGSGLCRGDIAHVADLTSGFTVGTCVMGDFTPYARPRG